MSISMGAIPSVIHDHSSSKLAGRGGTKTLSLTCPHAEKSSGVKSGDRVGQAIIPPCPAGIQLHDDWPDF